MRLKNKFDDYLFYLRQKGYAGHSIEEHKRFLFGAIAHSVAEIRLSKLRLTDISKVIEAGKVHKTYGSQRAVVTLRRYLHYLKESGFKLPFDIEDIKVPKVPIKPVEYLKPEELELVRNSIDIVSLPGLRTRALIEVLIATGMRISEAISLNKSDIDWEKHEAKVVNAKTDDVELIYFTDKSFFWLRKYLKARKDDLDALFVSGRGRLLSVSARNYLRNHTKNLGINKHIKHHIFRKTFATYLIKKKATIKEVQILCRHKSERTTLRAYVAIEKEDAKKAHQRILGKI